MLNMGYYLVDCQFFPIFAVELEITNDKIMIDFQKLVSFILDNFDIIKWEKKKCQNGDLYHYETDICGAIVIIYSLLINNVRHAVYMDVKDEKCDLTLHGYSCEVNDLFLIKERLGEKDTWEKKLAEKPKSEIVSMFSVDK